MFKKEFHISRLFASAMKGELKESEQEELDSWISVSAERQKLAENLGDEPGLNSELTRYANTDKSSLWQKVQHKLAEEHLEAERPTRKLWQHIAIAAAVSVMVLSAGLFYFKRNGIQEKYAQSAYRNEVPPGKIGAMLTLANGKKIKLADALNGEIAKQAGISITKTADGRIVYKMESSEAGQTASASMNTLATAKGEVYELTLPDHSKVWMNSASSISYTTNLRVGGQRRVKLEGEAYFEIAKDKTHPFVVESRGQDVEVLGTHFNVNTYKDEPSITTTLLEGAVKVSRGRAEQLIKPGEQVVNDGKQLKVGIANMDKVMDWKEGDFYLNHVNFKIAMRKIARWYDVEVIYDASVPNDIESGGWISRDKPLSMVLKSIESSGLVKFRIEGRKIYVSQ